MNKNGGEDIMYWGSKDSYPYGWALMAPLDRRYWWAGFSSTRYDGQMQYRNLAWRSRNDAIVSIPHAVIDDYGNLVPVPSP